MFYIFYSFTLLVCVEKNILPNLSNSQEPEQFFFGPLEPEALKKIPPAGAAKKLAGSPALLISKLNKNTYCV